MIEAMKSFLNASVNAFATPDSQRPELLPDNSKQQQKKNPKGFADSAAVEIRLSPQARALLEAMERGEIKLDEPQPEAREKAVEVLPPEDPNLAILRRLEDFAAQYGEGLLSEEEAATADRLFNELALTLGRAGQPAGDGPRAGELSPADQLKAAVLFNELNRLLGGAGVFFGRDRATARLTAEAQERAQRLQSALDETVFAGQEIELSAPQQARMDAILRELDRIYLGAASRLPKDQVMELEGIFADLGRVAAKPQAGLS